MRLSELHKDGDGTFIGVHLGPKSSERLSRWCKESLIPNIVDEFHCTLVYSQDTLPPVEVARYASPLVVEKDTYEYALFGDKQNILVLKIKQEILEDRWKELKEKYNFQYDFPTYIPHISLSYDVPEGFNINRLELPNFPIYLIGEYRETLKKDDEVDEAIMEDGRIVKNVNTTCDVDLDEIKVQAEKFGNEVSIDGVPVHSLYTVHKKMGKK